MTSTPSTDTRCCPSCRTTTKSYFGKTPPVEYCADPSCECHTEPKEWEENLEQKFAAFFCADCEKNEPHEIVKCNAQNTTNFYWMQGQLRTFIRETIAKEVKQERERIKAWSKNSTASPTGPTY